MFHWRWSYRPRNPLLRLLMAMAGAVLLVGIIVFGFFALLAFAFIGTIVAITRAVARAHAAPARAAHAGGDARVLEGEYVVLHKDAAPLNH